MCRNCDIPRDKWLNEIVEWAEAARNGEVPEEFKKANPDSDEYTVLVNIAARCAMLASVETGIPPSMQLGMWAGDMIQAEAEVLGAHRDFVQRNAPLN